MYQVSRVIRRRGLFPLNMEPFPVSAHGTWRALEFAHDIFDMITESAGPVETQSAVWHVPLEQLDLFWIYLILN